MENGIIKPPEIQERIICCHCKQFSGYTNEDIFQITIRVSREIDCENCGKPTIIIIGEMIKIERRIGIESIRGLVL